MNGSAQRSQNNFDFLRFLAATMVVASHSFWLHGSHDPDSPLIGTYGVGPIAVYAFFTISGFLITASCRNGTSTYNFITKRLLRIFPALVVATLLAILLVGPLTTRLPLGEYFSSSRTWGYLSNLVFWMQFDLPGVFTDNPFPGTVNGSLWTLPFVILLDLSLFALALSGRLTRASVLIGLALMALGGFVVLGLLEVQSKSVGNLFTLGLYFYAGAALYLFRQRLPWSWKIAAAATVVLGAGIALDLEPVAFALALPYLTLYLAYLKVPPLARFGRYGDFSYGIYIFSFPLQQLLVHALAAERWPVLAYLAASLAISVAAGVLSWHVIERPALGLKRYLPRRKPAPSALPLVAKH